MTAYATYNWSPAAGVVNVVFVQPGTFSSSGFPSDRAGHAYVAESGPTWATGPQTRGKRISEFDVDANGTLIAGPAPLVEYTGIGKATVAGLAAGPDGLYFSELYKDVNFTSAIDRGARILRVKYVGEAASTVHGVPGTIQAEDFDAGGEGAGYHDTTSGNRGGVYRSTDVDLETTTDAGGGFDIAWVTAGEWLSYSVDVAQAGTYLFEARVASRGAGGQFHLEVNGRNVSGAMTIPTPERGRRGRALHVPFRSGRVRFIYDSCSIRPRREEASATSITSD